jgi:hypothetical protein
MLDESPPPPPPAAVRGERLFDRDELRGHLIQLFRLENVGVLLGAGASKGAGGLLISELWKRLAADFPGDVEWCKAQKLLGDKFPDETPNIEKFIDDLADAEKEWRRVSNPELPRLQEAIRSVRRTVLRAARLDEALWSDPNGDNARMRLEDHRRLLTRLVASRQPGQPSSCVFTTNYDLALEWAAEALGIEAKTGFLGLHQRRFSPHSFDLVPRNVLARGEASLGSYTISVVKLHGSLSWRIDEKTRDVTELPAGTVDGPLKQFISEGKSEPSARLIYPSSAKYRQTVQFVYGELFRRFTEFLSKPQAALIVCGYSFSDDHLNRIIQAGLLNPTLQVVVYCREMDFVDGKLVLKAGAPSQLEDLFNLRLPRVTFVGGGDSANFLAMTQDLPDPATTDAPADELERILRILRRRDPAAAPKAGL